MTESNAGKLTNAFALVVRFTLKQGHEEEFDRMMTTTVEEIHRNEPNTVAYLVHHVQDEPLTRIFYELYRDEQAFEYHETSSHILRFAEERQEYVEKVAVDRMSVFTHAGITRADDS